MSDKSRCSPFVRQCFVTAAVCANVVGLGCSIGFAGVLLPQLQKEGSRIQVTEEQASWLAAIGSVIMVFGNFAIPAVMTRAGRKVASYAVMFGLLLGWFIIVLAPNYEVLLAGRIFQGLAAGMFMPLRSVLIGEYTSPRHRGGFLTTISLAQTFGVLFVHLTGSLISYQMTALASMSFTFLSLCMTIYCPESPSWLATRRQYDKCRQSFIWLRGEEEIPELDKMIQSVKQLDGQIKEQNKLKGMLAVAKKKEFYKPILLMFALYIMVGYSGGVIMGAYSVTVLNLLMGPDINAHFWMVALDCQRLFFSFVAVYVIHKVRRRTMLFTVGALCAGSQLCMGGYVFARSKGLLPFDSLWIPGVLINVQMLTVSMGMQPLPAVIAGEVLPLQHRSLAGSIGLVANCASIFVVLKAFPHLISIAGLQGTLTLYSGILVACLMVAYVLLPETSGRTLQQIEEYFRGDLEDTGAKEMEPLNGNLTIKIDDSDKDKTTQEENERALELSSHNHIHRQMSKMC